jgi:hypothetical protein
MAEMSKWLVYSDSFGNDVAKFKDTIGGIEVTAFLHDCDGDFVEWGVSHNGERYADGMTRADGDTMQSEQDAWNEAKLAC